MYGFLALHRKIRKSAVFNDLELFRLWTICLTEASHKEHEILVGRQNVKLQKGQFVTGRFDLHRMYNEGLKQKNFVSEKTVWRWLETLQKLENVTINSTNKFSIVTVVNWSLYNERDQQIDQQVTSKRPTDDQQVTTNNNGNKGNKVKEKIYMSFDDMEHVKITQDDFGKLAMLLGDEEKVMEKLYAFASWILTQPKKKQETASAYLSIISWHKRDSNKPNPSIHQHVPNYSYSAKDREAEMMLKAAADAKKAQASGIDFEPRTD